MSSPIAPPAPPLRTVFAGTPVFAVASLDAALAHPMLDVCAVYTQPDRPSGRGRKARAGEVKVRAMDAALPVYQPQQLDADAVAGYRALKPELLIVAAYGLILPAAVIDAPRHAINVHASLLPRWRGAAPIQRAIMAGDSVSGISIMRVVEQLDAGPVWLERACPIAADETGGTLHDKLAALGASALTDAIDALFEGCIVEQPQDDGAATYAHKLTADDRDISWARAAAELDRQIRALAPRPGARARLGAIDVTLLAVRPLERTLDAPAGSVVIDGGELLVATGNGVLIIDALKPAGKQQMTAAAFINGYGQHL